MNRTAPAFSVGTRAAGAVIVAGYLTGLVPGAVVSVVGGLALITFGRALLLDRVSGAGVAAALAVTAGALGVGALRWGTLELEGLIGAQSVIGPTVSVGPTPAAVSAVIATVAALVAIGVWLTEPRAASRGSWIWFAVESVLMVATLASVFAVPSAGGGTGLGGFLSAVGRDAAAWGLWLAGLVVAVVVTLVLSVLLRGRDRVRWVALLVSGVAVTAAAGTIATVV
ncbi:MAG: hypothetical protein ACRDKT_17285 [Actinomycetota bacterium]